MPGKVLYKASIEKDLKKIDRSTTLRLLEKIEQELAKDPNLGRLLTGEFRGLLKYRIGDYRVIYSKIPEGILILRIGHRKQVYR